MQYVWGYGQQKKSEENEAKQPAVCINHISQLAIAKLIYHN